MSSSQKAKRFFLLSENVSVLYYQFQHVCVCKYETRLDKESTTFCGRRYKQIAENVVLSPRLNKVTNEYMERKNSTPNFACC